MVHKWLWLRVRRDVLLYEHPLDVKEVALKRVQESTGLQVLRRRATMQNNQRQISLQHICTFTYTEMPSSLMIYPIP